MQFLKDRKERTQRKEQDTQHAEYRTATTRTATAKICTQYFNNYNNKKIRSKKMKDFYNKIMEQLKNEKEVEIKKDFLGDKIYIDKHKQFWTNSIYISIEYWTANNVNFINKKILLTKDLEKFTFKDFKNFIIESIKVNNEKRLNSLNRF
jgi:hypothetical protein